VSCGPSPVLTDEPTLAPQQDMNASISVTHARLANLPDALFEAGLSGETRFVLVGGCVKQKHRLAGSKHLPLAAFFFDARVTKVILHTEGSCRFVTFTTAPIARLKRKLTGGFGSHGEIADPSDARRIDLRLATIDYFCTLPRVSGVPTTTFSMAI
jgi:hypothetical protein